MNFWRQLSQLSTKTLLSVLALVALVAIPGFWAFGLTGFAIGTALFVATLALHVVCFDLPVAGTRYRTLERLWQKAVPSKAKK